jgi:hypothetical protein
VNKLVVAELEKQAAASRVRLEKALAAQRQTPSLIGNSGRQLAHQRRVKELRDQADSWMRVVRSANELMAEDQ